MRYQLLKITLKKPIIRILFQRQGNNSELVRRVLQTRNDWTEVNSGAIATNLNLIWYPTSYSIKFDRIKKNQVVNHFEYHRELTTKNRLIKNLEDYCKLHQIYTYDITPITFCINYDNLSQQYDIEEFLSYYLQNSSAPAVEMIAIESLRKNNYQRTLLNDLNQQQEKSSQNNRKVAFSQPRNHQCLFTGKNIWIFKPSDTNRGRGIKLFNKISQFQQILQEYNENTISSNGKKSSYRQNRQFVIQKYIEQPLLINNRKFDIRMWAMLTYEMQIFIFKEGYVRTAAEKYDQNNFNDLIIHLTNNAIQKQDKRYNLYEDGNQLSFKSLEDHIKNNIFKNKILPRMKEYIVFSLDSVKNKINIMNRQGCFEIFGYDFVIDNQYNPWLIEVNTNPCLEESSLLLKHLVPRMIDDAFKIVIDNVFPSKHIDTHEEKKLNNKYFPVKGYYDYENLWESYPSNDYYLLKTQKNNKAK